MSDIKWVDDSLGDKKIEAEAVLERTGQLDTARNTIRNSEEFNGWMASVREMIQSAVEDYGEDATPDSIFEHIRHLALDAVPQPLFSRISNELTTYLQDNLENSI